MKVVNVRGERQMYNYDDVFNSTLEYFNNDELAANVFFKYALKDKGGVFYERNPDDMHHRLADEFFRIEEKFGGERKLSKNKIYSMFKDFKWIVPQGSPMAGIGNEFQTMSTSNCIVVSSPADTMSAIIDKGKDLANLMKRRCGVGLDISTLRPDGSSVSNAAGTSSGAWSFSDFYSFITRMVGQNNRRGALLISMDIKHPDVEKFIVMKHDLKKVTGANVSIKISDEFMRAVEEDSEFVLQFPVDCPVEKAKTTRTVKAKELWGLIINSATKTAEPGLIFWDNALRTLPSECYSELGFKTITTNPCAELLLGANGSCRLISQNLKNYVINPFSKQAYFDFKKLKKDTAIAQRLSDDLVELEVEKLQSVIDAADTKDEKKLFSGLLKTCLSGRRTGLGTHGLADAIARMGIRYDSDRAVELVEEIYSIRKNAAYKESVDLAKERGSFPVWDWELEKNNDFIQSLDRSIRSEMAVSGRRNISILTNAPTGSVSILSQTSSGIEPVFKNIHTRRKKRNHDEINLDSDFVDDMGDRWAEFEVSHHNVKEWQEINGNKSLPGYFVESGTIDWNKRIDIQSAAQRHIDHSISSTINLPEGTEPEVVGQIYMNAWKLGLKGVTVYVDGSRTGVLVSKKDEEKDIGSIDAPKRPDELECDIHTVSVKGEKWVILVGLMKGKPYEVFGGLSENVEIPSKYKTGTVIKASENKKAANRYDLRLNGVKIKNITKMFDNSLYQLHTRMVSLGLRHGVRPSFLAEQLLKDPDSDLTSFSKVLARVLKKYIEDGTKVSGDKVCANCKEESLVYSEGCVICINCSWSRCS